MPTPQSRSVCTNVLILGSACSLTKWSEPPGKGTSGRWTTSGRCSEEEDSAPWTTCRLSAQSVTERSVPSARPTPTRASVASCMPAWERPGEAPSWAGIQDTFYFFHHLALCFLSRPRPQSQMGDRLLAFRFIPGPGSFPTAQQKRNAM